MSRAAGIYKFTCGPLGADILLVGGGFYKLLSATGTIKVSREDGSAIGPLLPGQGEREEFTRLAIQDTSGAANTGFILIADKSFEDTRIYGQVEVIDGAAVRSKANASFIGGTFVSAVAGQYGHMQLWNPAGSGKNLVLAQTHCSVKALCDVLYRWNTTALSTNPGILSSKQVGGAAGVATVRSENNAALLGTQFDFAHGLASSPLILKFTDQMVIRPGFGVIIAAGAVNIEVAAMFEWYEENQ